MCISICINSNVHNFDLKLILMQLSKCPYMVWYMQNFQLIDILYFSAVAYKFIRQLWQNSLASLTVTCPRSSGNDLCWNLACITKQQLKSNLLTVGCIWCFASVWVVRFIIQDVGASYNKERWYNCIILYWYATTLSSDDLLVPISPSILGKSTMTQLFMCISSSMSICN